MPRMAERCWVCGGPEDTCGWVYTGISIPHKNARGRIDLRMAAIHELCQPLARGRYEPLCPLEGPKPYEAVYG